MLKLKQNLSIEFHR